MGLKNTKVLKALIELTLLGNREATLQYGSESIELQIVRHNNKLIALMKRIR